MLSCTRYAFSIPDFHSDRHCTIDDVLPSHSCPLDLFRYRSTNQFSNCASVTTDACNNNSSCTVYAIGTRSLTAKACTELIAMKSRTTSSSCVPNRYPSWPDRFKVSSRSCGKCSLCTSVRGQLRTRGMFEKPSSSATWLLRVLTLRTSGIESDLEVNMHGFSNVGFGNVSMPVWSWTSRTKKKKKIPLNTITPTRIVLWRDTAVRMSNNRILPIINPIEMCFYAHNKCKSVIKRANSRWKYIRILFFFWLINCIFSIFIVYIRARWTVLETTRKPERQLSIFPFTE